MELARYKLNFWVHRIIFFLNNTLKIILQDTKIDEMGIAILMIRKNTFYALCIVYMVYMIATCSN